MGFGTTAFEGFGSTALASFFALLVVELDSFSSGCARSSFFLPRKSFVVLGDSSSASSGTACSSPVVFPLEIFFRAGFGDSASSGAAQLESKRSLSYGDEEKKTT